MTSAVLKKLLPLHQPSGVHGYIFYGQKKDHSANEKSVGFLSHSQNS